LPNLIERYGRRPTGQTGVLALELDLAFSAVDHDHRVRQNHLQRHYFNSTSSTKQPPTSFNPTLEKVHRPRARP
jgi:hypothetical protein